MGIKERRLRERLRRKTEIIAAAETVIFKKGIAKATMKDIANEAELGKATLYVYYKSKDEILLDISERAHNQLAALFEEAIKGKETGYDMLQAIGWAYFKFAEEYPNYLNFILLFEYNHLEISQDPLVNLQVIKNQVKADEIMERVIQVGIKDGSIRGDLSPNILSKCLWGMATGIVQILQTKGEAFEMDENITKEAMIANFFFVVEKGVAPSA